MMMLFTAILIKGLSPKTNYLRQTLLTENHKFIMCLNDEERTTSDLPIFNFVCQHVLSHQSTLQYTNRMRKPTIQFPTDNNNSNKYVRKIILKQQHQHQQYQMRQTRQ